MNILGLDLSLTATGWYWISEEQPIAGGTIAPKNIVGVHRLNWLKKELDNLIDKTTPDLVMVEGYSFGSMMSRAHSIGEWGGLARWSLLMAGVRTIIVPPSSLKQFVTGKGTAKKEDMKLWAFKRWKKEFNTNDECDAFCLAQVGFALWQGTDAQLTDKQIKALNKVEVYYDGQLKASDFKNTCRVRRR